MNDGERECALMKHVAEVISGHIVTGHDWPNTQHELDILSAARLLRKHSVQPLSVQETDVVDAWEECIRMQNLLKWAYSKLVYRSFDNMDDALKMDEIKLELTKP